MAVKAVKNGMAHFFPSLSRARTRFALRAKILLYGEYGERRFHRFHRHHRHHRQIGRTSPSMPWSACPIDGCCVRLMLTRFCRQSVLLRCWRMSQ